MTHFPVPPEDGADSYYIGWSLLQPVNLGLPRPMPGGL